MTDMLENMFSEENRDRATNILNKINKIFCRNFHGRKIHEVYAISGYIISSLICNSCLSMFSGNEVAQKEFMELIFEAAQDFIKQDENIKKMN